VGPVHIDLSRETRDDLTVMDVPEDCVGFVMGRAGATLRSMEEEWGSLMFFAQVYISLLYIMCIIYVPLNFFNLKFKRSEKKKKKNGLLLINTGQCE
jgi:hypothetical protein